MLSLLATAGWILLFVLAVTDEEFRDDFDRGFDDSQASGRRFRSPPPQSGFSPETVGMLARPMANPYVKQYFMTAGPTPLPPAVSQVMAEPMLYHRAPAFIEVYARVLERLKMVFQTAERRAPVRVVGHGRDGVGRREPGPPGEPALVASCGKFGERWVELCEAYGAAQVHHDAGWGSRVEPGDLDRAARRERRASASSSPRSPRPRPASSTTSASSPRWPTVTAR